MSHTCALADGSTLDEAVSNVQDHLMEINGVVYTDNTTLSYRLDGNNVSIDTEEVYQTENTIRYQALIEQMTHEYTHFYHSFLLCIT